MRWRRPLDNRVSDVLAGSTGERLLAWGELAGGSVAVCTDVALHVPDRRIPWELVVRAAWSEEFLDLVVQPAPGLPTAHVRLRFDAPGEVPAVVRERVEWTVLASHAVTLQLPDGTAGGATLNARRAPGTGEVRWSVAFEPGIDPADPQWRAAADQALSRIRAQTGI